MKTTLPLLITLLFVSATTQSQTLYFPPLTGNVWDSVTPTSLNYCQPRIDSLYNYLQSKNTKSFIILKDGKRVLEKYFGTYTRDSIWYWASASKSLASFITGVAQQKGYININNKVSAYIGTGWTSESLAKEDLITVRNLLTMTTGTNDQPPAPCDHLDTSKNCLQYLADAGTRWGYHTGAYYKVQDVVSKAVGLSYNAITTSWIKTKIGMGGAWNQQIYYSKARDMARFGLLALNKGVWNNDTILKDTAYFNAMTTTSQNLNLAYGYLWWLNGKATGMAPGSQIVFNGPLMPNAPSDMFCALGKNDQKIYVVPSQNLVIVRQGNSAGGFSLAQSAFDNVLWDYINKLNCNSNGINTATSALPIVAYPNPVNDNLIIENSALQLQSVVVYDVLGNTVFTANTSNQTTITLNFASYNKGVYLLACTNANNITVRKKIMKQ